MNGFEKWISYTKKRLTHFFGEIFTFWRFLSFERKIQFYFHRLEIQPAKSTLRSLNLRNNQLEFVHGQMLQGFDQLRSVDLSHNDLIVKNC